MFVSVAGQYCTGHRIYDDTLFNLIFDLGNLSIQYFDFSQDRGVLAPNRSDLSIDNSDPSFDIVLLFCRCGIAGEKVFNPVLLNHRYAFLFIQNFNFCHDARDSSPNCSLTRYELISSERKLNSIDESNDLTCSQHVAFSDIKSY